MRGELSVDDPAESAVRGGEGRRTTARSWWRSVLGPQGRRAGGASMLRHGRDAAACCNALERDGLAYGSSRGSSSTPSAAEGTVWGS